MEVVRKPGFTVVGIRVEAEWDELWTAMPRAWELFRSRSPEIAQRTSDSFMDICLAKQGDTYVQLIGAEVSTINETPEGMTAITILEEVYIHHRHTGLLPEIATSFGMMYEWAEQNGYQADDFKLDVGYTRDGEAGPHDLYVRVANEPGSP